MDTAMDEAPPDNPPREPKAGREERRCLAEAEIPTSEEPSAPATEEAEVPVIDEPESFTNNEPMIKPEPMSPKPHANFTGPIDLTDDELYIKKEPFSPRPSFKSVHGVIDLTDDLDESVIDLTAEDINMSDRTYDGLKVKVEKEEEEVADENAAFGPDAPEIIGVSRNPSPEAAPIS